MINLGFHLTSGSRTHVRFQFSTHAAAGGNVAPSSAFEAADLRIYRAADGAAYSATQRSSANGITMTSPFDTLTGVHDVDIDLTDNTDAGFYASGYSYSVILAPDETVDSQTITGIVLATFEIGYPPVNTAQIEGADPSDTIRDAVVDDATRIDASALNTASVTTIPAILDDTDLIDDGTSGLAKIATDVAAILVDTGTTLQAELDGIQADTEDIQSKIGSPAGASVSADIAAVKVDTAAILVDTGTTLDAKIDVIDGIVDSILVDTGTTLQAELDGIQADTEDIQSRLPASLSGGFINANIEAVNGTSLQGDGSSGDKWRPV